MLIGSRPCDHSRPHLYICTFLISCAFAAAFAAVEARADTTLPAIVVEADQFSVYLADEKAIWRGNVEATQGNYTFRTSQLTVRLDDVVAARADSSGDGPADSAGADDSVELRADRVTYDLDRDEIQGLGNSELRRGVEFIRADNIVYEVGNRIARATPSANGRVRVQFLSTPGKGLFPGAALADGAGAGE